MREHQGDVHRVAEAIQAGTIPGRGWFYSKYHCNLACTHCFTESSPAVAERAMDPGLILRLVAQAGELGDTDFGITGGEPFVVPYMVDLTTNCVRCTEAGGSPTTTTSSARSSIGVGPPRRAWEPTWRSTSSRPS